MVKRGSDTTVNNHCWEQGSLSLSLRSPLRLNNSHMNEIMTVRVSAVWLLLAWNWYKYYQDRLARDDGVMMSTSEDNSAHCHRHHPHTLSGLEITGRKKADGTYSRGKVTIYIQPVSVWQHWLILPDRSQSHMLKQERINKELAGSLWWKKRKKKKKKKRLRWREEGGKEGSTQ